MEERIDLTEGKIVSKLVKLALPIMGTSFIQMAYNMTDMIWIGKVGSKAVAGVGTAGFYTWLAMAFIMISKTGAEIKVAQKMGEHNLRKVKSYIVSAIQINVVLSILYTVVLLVFSDKLIGFFNLGDAEVISMSKTYLVIVAIGMIFYFINPVFTAIFNGAGSSKTPFVINTIGLAFNMVFDPVLILGIGPFPKMGVAGAAIATVIAQVIVSLSFIFVMIKGKDEYLKVNVFTKPRMDYIKVLCNIGLPGGIQNGLFTIFSMCIGRIIAVFGPVPIAVQKVGSQIEAISWMTAGGFSTALGTFVGQNYGSKKYNRINKGVKVTMVMAVIIGILASLLLILGGEYVFSFFLNDPEAVDQGTVYLRILGYSQLFMCIEITITGAFNGLGRTYIPSIIGILLTGARVPASYFLCNPNVLGLDGIWWSISISSILKGTVLLTIYLYLLRKRKLYREEI
ncbi:MULTISPECIES: MATE family efflux transporter [Clostridium]|uniref:Probable multidrug resistance protein NorM n=1 Tax=Clostridium botulinum TaxID=1491 RepID=A0A6B4MNK6_CLOBO|nr:MATE family efflux transporter [Clostridium botulinum]ACD52963.1 mate efflux family protein [Clostridium botulinum E3 str. Alaska E43]AJF29286.1 multidrug transporter MatE [Clostridium botulinum]AJF32347.1 multidrug transporter MatE [Clostridium botulinum]EES49970.1 mate efflux family protein [Clostridium botulinum E1 str. 'BoNT E Beluga']KIL09525.1 multidrug transporter MatE [Clostridium botulinum]